MDRCDGCGKPTRPEMLDAVLLDKNGNRASMKAYCRTCFPKFKKIPTDRWSSLSEETPHAD